jgi:hypothetical protein
MCTNRARFQQATGYGHTMRFLLFGHSIACGSFDHCYAFIAESK